MRLHQICHASSRLSAALGLLALGSAAQAQLAVTNNQFFVHGTGGLTVGTPTASFTSFARSLAIGDFNCDGFDDAAISNTDADVNGAIEAGQVIVVYGSVAGFRVSDSEAWSQSSANVPGGSEDNDHWGSALAAGKLSTDTCDDLVVGAAEEDLRSPVLTTTGAVTMLPGSSSGLTATAALMLPDDVETGDNGPQQSDEFGTALVIGNILNVGGSLDELVIGVTGDQPNGFVARGGSVDIRRANSSVPLAGRVGRFFQDEDATSSIESNDDFGAALAIGDFDSDGLGDVAIGAPGESTDGVNAVGAVTVIYGSGSPFTGGGVISFDQNTSGIPGANELDDNFGAALAAGDFDGDGDDDLAIGVPQEDVGNGFNEGMVVIRNGRANGINGFDASLSFDAVTFGIDNAPSSTVFGRHLASGDFNADGFADLAVSATDADIGGFSGAGVVVVIYGQAAGLTTSGAQLWHQNVTGIPGAAAQGDFFGSALGVGDFDGDGIDDLLIGISGENGSGSNQGAIQVLFGRSAAPRPNAIFANGFQ